MIFSTRENLLSLYNAVNHSHYTDASELEIVTLKNAVYMNMKNDQAFLLDMQLNLYEHQSTWNPNMPLRFLMYVAKEYQMLVRNQTLYASALVKVPTPHFVVFYNGETEQEAETILRLSHSFQQKTDKPELELMVRVLNINLDKKQEVLEACQLLKEYMLLVNKIRRYTDESGNQIETDPQMLGDMFCNFVQKVLGQYGYITTVYADSAEQTLIAGIRSSLRHNGLGWIRVENALKAPINDRINAVLILMAQGRFWYVGGECNSLVNALCTAVWDPKELTKNVRLDDGTSDIDSLDSFEYTLERRISQLIKYG